MKITKNTILKIEHVRKGTFLGIAETDFDTSDEWYPIALAQETEVKGVSPHKEWNKGDSIPCRASLCKIKKLKK